MANQNSKIESCGHIQAATEPTAVNVMQSGSVHIAMPHHCSGNGAPSNGISPLTSVYPPTWQRVAQAAILSGNGLCACMKCSIFDLGYCGNGKTNTMPGSTALHCCEALANQHARRVSRKDGPRKCQVVFQTCCSWSVADKKPGIRPLSECTAGQCAHAGSYSRLCVSL